MKLVQIRKGREAARLAREIEKIKLPDKGVRFQITSLKIFITGIPGTESDVKLKVRVPVVNRSDCAAVFNRVARDIINKQICAGGNAGQDSCRGDSGGSLMGRAPTAENWLAVGVVSYGPSPCGTPGWPGVYTRVGAYVDWILSKLRP